MSLVDPSRFAPWYCPPPLFRNIELGRIEVSSGRLAIRDVYDLNYPQVVLNVDPGNYRVWSTELNIRTKPGAPLFRPAYLSIQLSDAPRKRIDFPEDLYGKPAPPYGISVSNLVEDSSGGVVLIGGQVHFDGNYNATADIFRLPNAGADAR